MKSIAIFRSAKFDMSWGDGYPETRKCPLGNDLANYLQTRLKEKGILLTSPVGDDGFWVFHDAHFSIYVHWQPFGEPSEDWWVVEVGHQLNFIKRILWFKANPDDLQPICKVVHEVLLEIPEIHDLKWVDEVEFREL